MFFSVFLINKSLSSAFTCLLEKNTNKCIPSQFSSHFLSNFSSLALSFHQAKFCPTATWSQHGIPFANQSIVGHHPLSILVDKNNTIYVANREHNTILVWHEGSSNPTNIISGNFTDPHSLFVASNGDIYIDDGGINHRVQKWIAKTKTFATVMHVNSSCTGLFVDTNHTLYCSLYQQHQVVKRSLNDPDVTSISVAAGTGYPSTASNGLKTPRGIFVDVNFDLYVADCGNDRILLFQSGESNGVILVGFGSRVESYPCPSAIVLDAEKYLFYASGIIDRTIGSSLNGIRCSTGCYYRGGYYTNEINSLTSLSFDRSGNIFLVNSKSGGIEKFEFLQRSCGKSK